MNIGGKNFSVLQNFKVLNLIQKMVYSILKTFFKKSGKQKVLFPWIIGICVMTLLLLL